MRTWLRYLLTGSGVIVVAVGAAEFGHSANFWWLTMIGAGALVAAGSARPEDGKP